MTDLGWWGVPLGVLGGALRVSTPFLFVSLGECITEKSGRINLGLEGILVMGAMTGYAVSFVTGNPWFGVLAAGIAGFFLGLLHGLICNLPKVNDIAVGIGLMLFGTQGAEPAVHILWRLERHAAGSGGAAGEPAVPDRHCAGIVSCLGLSQYALGTGCAHGR